jgi:hypothetical protein
LLSGRETPAHSAFRGIFTFRVDFPRNADAASFSVKIDAV